MDLMLSQIWNVNVSHNLSSIWPLVTYITLLLKYMYLSQLLVI